MALAKLPVEARRLARSTNLFATCATCRQRTLNCVLCCLSLGAFPPAALQHGMEGVRDHSDGYPEAWFMPDADEIPERFAKVRWLLHLHRLCCAVSNTVLCCVACNAVGGQTPWHAAQVTQLMTVIAGRGFCAQGVT